MALQQVSNIGLLPAKLVAPHGNFRNQNRSKNVKYVKYNQLSNTKMFSKKPSVIIDNGSYSCKAGFSCDNHPVSIFRTVVGRPKDRQGFYGKVPYQVYVGDEAVCKSDYELNSPVVRGKIVHWDDMERVWHHIFYKELRVAPEEREVILAISPTSPLEEKMHCCEIFFETLNCPALSCQSQSVLALYASGYSTGLSVDLGYDITDVNPIYEGGPINYAHVETFVSGRNICSYITDSFKARGIDLGDYADKVIEDIKHRFLCISPIQPTSCTKIQYKLPSGEIIDITKEIHCAGELIFQPEMVVGPNTECISLQNAVITATHKCDADLHNDLLSAIVPTGGFSTAPGFIHRLTHELQNLLDRPVNVIATSETYCVSWLGGAIFAGMKDSRKLLVSKKQFEEYGEKIVRNKFM